MWEERLKLYDAAVAKCPRFERKGKSMPYTSANGHMFSLLNKDGELGIRFSKDVQARYKDQWNSGDLRSHGASMRGYVRVPEHMWDDLLTLARYLVWILL